MKKFIRYYLPALIWLILIFTLPYTIRHNSINLGIKNLDKVVHFVEFVIFGLLFMRALYYGFTNKDKSKTILITVGVSLFIAAFDEFYQIYIPGRMASMFDFTADFLGIISALFIFIIVTKKSKILE